MKFLIAFVASLFTRNIAPSQYDRGYSSTTNALEAGNSPCVLLSRVDFTGHDRDYVRGVTDAIRDHASKHAFKRQSLWRGPVDLHLGKGNF